MGPAQPRETPVRGGVPQPLKTFLCRCHGSTVPAHRAAMATPQAACVLDAGRPLW